MNLNPPQKRVDPIKAFDQPVARSRPEFLEVIGRLRGMSPRPADQARVLEIGCAAGQNLLPMALRNPAGTFVGVDPGGRAVAMARQTASELELANVTLHRQNLAELSGELGKFDYIIARDSYSRVGPDQRDLLLTFVRDHLNSQGLAFLGYQTYPGANVTALLGSLMRYDARRAETPSQQVAAARTVADFLHSALLADAPYDKLVRGELATILPQTDAALLRDFLDPASQPEYLPRFTAHAGRFGLAPVGDATLGTRGADDLGAEAEARLSALTDDPIQKEFCRDVVRNRSFRQAVLCHDDALPTRETTPAMLAGLYLAAPLKSQAENVNLSGEHVDRFVVPAGLQISTTVPLIKAALLHLGELWPNSILFDELPAAAAARLEQATGAATPAGEMERLRDNLLLCCTAGLIELDSRPPAFTTAIAARPVASPLARWQLARGTEATNGQHQMVRLEYFDQYVLRLLDGTMDAGNVLEQLAGWTAEGRLTIVEGQVPVRSLERARQIFAVLLPEALARIARSALLVG